MLFKRRLSYRVTFTLGLVFLVISSVTRLVFERRLHVSDHIGDPILGVLYGISIGFLMVSVITKSRGPKQA